MRISTIIVLIITVLLTVVIMQNTDEVKFTLLFTDVYMPKLVMMTAVSVVAFILGVLVGRPRKVRRFTEAGHNDDDDDITPRNTKTLSDEDRDYIS